MSDEYVVNRDVTSYSAKMSWDRFRFEWVCNDVFDDINRPIDMTRFEEEKEIEVVIWQPRKNAIYKIEITDGGEHYRAIRAWYLKTKRKLLRK